MKSIQIGFDTVLTGVTRSSTLDTYSRRSQSAAGSGSAQHAVDYQYSPISRLDQVVTGSHSATYGYLEPVPKRGFFGMVL